jgi:hypothetical protein
LDEKLRDDHLSITLVLAACRSGPCGQLLSRADEACLPQLRSPPMRRARGLEPPDAQRRFAGLEQADPSDGGPTTMKPGVACPADGKPAAHRGGPLGDYGVGLPAGQALATPGIVLVADADHIAGLKEPGRYRLTNHEAPGQGCGQCPYTCRTPTGQRRVTGVGVKIPQNSESNPTIRSVAAGQAGFGRAFSRPVPDAGCRLLSSGWGVSTLEAAESVPAERWRLDGMAPVTERGDAANEAARLPALLARVGLRVWSSGKHS